MKFLFRTEAGKTPEYVGPIHNGDDVNSLPHGNYIVAEQNETIRVVGGGCKSAITTTRPVEQQQKQTVTTKKQRVTVKDGLCYVDGVRKKMEGEPFKHEGKLFTGTISPEGKLIPKQSSSSVDDLKAIAESLASGEIAESLASGESVKDDLPKEDAPFDDAGFLDDLDMTDSCQIGDDKLTLTVSLKGSRYQKKFKTEQGAARQHETITAYLKEKNEMVDELLTGPASTWSKA